MAVPWDMPFKPWKVIHADIFNVKNTMLFCIVDYYTKLSIMKEANGLSADGLIRATKNVFEELGLPKKIVSETGTNVASN